MDCGGQDQKSGKSTSRTFCKLVVIYFSILFVLGEILHHSKTPMTKTDWLRNNPSQSSVLSTIFLVLLPRETSLQTIKMNLRTHKKWKNLVNDENGMVKFNLIITSWCKAWLSQRRINNGHAQYHNYTGIIRIAPNVHLCPSRLVCLIFIVHCTQLLALLHPVFILKHKLKINY